MREELPESPYFVFLNRWQRRSITDIWAIELSQSLPNIPISLLPEDEDVVLDLQTAFTNVYDSIGYDLLLDYTRPADIPLKSKAAKWAAELLAS